MVTLNNMVDDSTLLLIITETGRFQSFQDVYEGAKCNGGTVVILVEEYNTALFNQCDKIFWLSRILQPAHLKPYEKSRTLFFIFLRKSFNACCRKMRFLASAEWGRIFGPRYSTLLARLFGYRL